MYNREGNLQIQLAKGENTSPERGEHLPRKAQPLLEAEAEHSEDALAEKAGSSSWHTLVYHIPWTQPSIWVLAKSPCQLDKHIFFFPTGEILSKNKQTNFSSVHFPAGFLSLVKQYIQFGNYMHLGK